MAPKNERKYGRATIRKPEEIAHRLGTWDETGQRHALTVLRGVEDESFVGR